MRGGWVCWQFSHLKAVRSTFGKKHTLSSLTKGHLSHLSCQLFERLSLQANRCRVPRQAGKRFCQVVTMWSFCGLWATCSVHKYRTGRPLLPFVTMGQRPGHRQFLLLSRLNNFLGGLTCSCQVIGKFQCDSRNVTVSHFRKFPLLQTLLSAFLNGLHVPDSLRRQNSCPSVWRCRNRACIQLLIPVQELVSGQGRAQTSCAILCHLLTLLQTFPRCSLSSRHVSQCAVECFVSMWIRASLSL